MYGLLAAFIKAEIEDVVTWIALHFYVHTPPIYEILCYHYRISLVLKFTLLCREQMFHYKFRYT